MRKILFLLPIALLASCAGTTQSQWANDVATVQAAWPMAEVAINLALAETHAKPDVVAAAQKAEGQISAEVAALSATASPAGAAVIMGDVKDLVSALPPGTLSPTHDAEVQAALAGLTLLVNYTGG